MSMKKAVFLSLAVLFVTLLEVSVPSVAVAASAGDVIGVIDSQGIISKHPKFENAAKELQEIGRRKESEAKTASDNESDPTKKAQVVQAKRRELAQEEQRLMEPIFKDCQEAVRVVAKKKNVTLVLEKASVYFGGQDITEDVVQQLKISGIK